LAFGQNDQNNDNVTNVHNPDNIQHSSVKGEGKKVIMKQMIL